MISPRFDNTVALVTGAARVDGIGQGIVRRLVAEGARVVFTDVDIATGEATASSMPATSTLFMHHDVTCETDWQAVLEATLSRFGRLDMLINNAGIPLPGGIAATSLEQLRRGMTINFESQYLGIRTCAPVLGRFAADRPGGAAIVNNSSMAAYLADPTAMAYHVSKAAVRMLTMCAAREYGPQRIRVNSVHYGPVLTHPMQQALRHYTDRGQFADPQAALSGIAALSPLGITGTVDEAGALAAFLCSDEARFITGAAYWQDGGCFMQY